MDDSPLRERVAGRRAGARHPGRPLCVAAALLGTAVGAAALAPQVADSGWRPAPAEAVVAALHFREVDAQASGLSVAHRSGAPGAAKRHMIECVGPGAGLFDADGDGDLDAWQVRGGQVQPDGLWQPAAEPDVLYLNDGTAHFAPAPQADTGRGFGFGVSAADVDGDADLDVYLTDLGPNRLLRNAGDARFAPVPDAGGAAGAVDDWSMAGAFADPDADGDLDLYVTNYLAHDLSHPMIASGRPCRWLGCEVPCGPKGLAPQADRYFVNDGAGGFAEGTQAAGFAAVAPAYAFQATWTDVDDDGLLDLFVANDSMPHYLFRNLGPSPDAPARFAEQGLAAGCALSDTGKEQAGMGVAAGDLDGNGQLDLVMTNFSQEQNAAFRNQSRPGQPLLFDDGSRTGLGWPSFHDLGWGANLLDADLDGDLDLFVANGHVYPHVDGCGISHTTFAQRCRLYEQVAPGRFRDATDRAGPALQVAGAHRGSAAGDLDGDGDADLLVACLDATPRLLLNESVRAGIWLRIVLAPAARAPGARITLTGAERTWVGEARAGSSFLGVEDPAALLVGVPGDASFAATVRWPGGRVETFSGLRPGQTVVLTLGSGAGP